MKKISWRYLIGVFITLSCMKSTYSQWLKLPNITSIPSYTPFGFSSLTYPVNIVPTANNVIIWNLRGSVSPSSGGYINSYISKNDLNSSNCLNNCNYSPSYGCCSIDLLQSFNDSTFTYINVYQGWYRQIFKIDNSTTVQNVSCPTNNSPISAVSVTDKSAYAISHSSYVNDTLLVVRTVSTIPLVQNITKLPNYQSFPNHKLIFSNDSLGFLTIRDRNNYSINKLLKTIDYGSSWTEIYIDSVNQIIDFSFPSENVGFIIKSDSTMFKTNDGGSTWVQLTNSGLSAFKCVKFANDTLGYVAGDLNALRKTINGGLTWTNEISGTLNEISFLYAFGDIAYYVDNQKNVYKNKDLSVIGVNELQVFENNIELYPNPAIGSFYLKSILFQNESFNVEVYNILGDVILKTEIGNNNNLIREILLQNIPNGIYSVLIRNSTKKISKKLIVNRTF